MRSPFGVDALNRARIDNPAGNGLAILVLIVVDKGGIGIVGVTEEGFNLNPVAASVEKDNFAPAFGLGELVRRRVGRNINDRLAHDGAAIGGRGGRGEGERDA